ncbi:MAG TPA: hypothetical protein ENN32_08550 [Chloroflexi bacterium]|nr:hypothetical protein [Chloroflexota bacterium]
MTEDTLRKGRKRILIIMAIALVAGLILFAALISLILISIPAQSAQSQEPVVTLIPYATPHVMPSPTVSVDDFETPSIVIEGITVGTVVQIVETGGLGLRLRANPGTAGTIQFVGQELELFTVVNGPVEQDGYVWWYLESPYDASRSGWAAASYLMVIESE